MTGVREQIDLIGGRIADGDLAEAQHALDELRNNWRGNPSSFGPQDVAELQTHARALTEARIGLVDDELKNTFGYTSFRPGQREIVEAAIVGQDCIGIMPTGAGKSLTYQLAAKVLGGTSLVISPKALKSISLG